MDAKAKLVPFRLRAPGASTRGLALLKAGAMAGEYGTAADMRALPAPVYQLLMRSAPKVQDVRVFVIEAHAECAHLLQGLITQLRGDLDKALVRLKTLHFLSMTVFADDQRFDPALVLEVNFDGSAGPFWGELELAIGPQLREILRFCKTPNVMAAEAFKRVTDSDAPIAPLLEAMAVRPVAVHQGDRGASRAQIEQETALFLNVRKAIGDHSRFQGKSAQEIHQTLRKELAPQNPIVTVKAPVWAPRLQGASDFLRLVGFGVFILVALHLPGMLLAWIISPFWAALALLPVIAMLGWSLRAELHSQKAQNTDEKRSRAEEQQLQTGPILLGVAAFVLFEATLTLAIVLLRHLIAALSHARLWLETKFGILALFFNQPKYIHAALETAGPAQGHFQLFPPGYLLAGVQSALLGLLGAAATGLFIVLRLRAIETQDPTQHQRDLDGRNDRQISKHEDHGEQNHMSGLVHIKPGLVRSIVMRVGLTFLGLAIREDPRSARDGYLVTVRTIHFAHLTLVSNGSRLLFLANFDGSWDNYLIDFIDKVHVWLTLVWTNGVGFPPTRFLVLDGATHGRLFTTWQRRSMAPTLYWFRAYPELSVEQIRRQAEIATGLRKKSLKKREAEAWASKL